jgi:hypothetical protein
MDICMYVADPYGYHIYLRKGQHASPNIDYYVLETTFIIYSMYGTGRQRIVSIYISGTGRSVGAHSYKHFVQIYVQSAHTYVLLFLFSTEGAQSTLCTCKPMPSD